MSDRPIQRYTGNVPAAAGSGAAIMTPQGPATIQIIDMPSGAIGFPAPGAPAGRRRKPGGINVIGAVMRRWWLVLVVFVVVGGSAFFAGANFVKPQYEGRARVSYLDNNPNSSGGGIANTVIHRAIVLINSHEIPLTAFRDPEVTAQFPAFNGKDLNDPAEQAALLSMVRDFVDTDESIKGMNVIDVFTLQPTAAKAKAVADAYAKALVAYCDKSVKENVNAGLFALENDYKETQLQLAAIQKRRVELKSSANFDANEQRILGTIEQIKKLTADKAKAQVEVAAAEAKYKALQNNNQRSPAQELKRLEIIEQEKTKDSILKTYVEQLSLAYTDLAKVQAEGKKDEHPDVIRANDAIRRAQKNVAAREAEIAEVIENKISRQFNLESANSVDQAKTAMELAQGQLRNFEEMEKKLSDEAKKFALVKMEIDELERQAAEVAKHSDETYSAWKQAEVDQVSRPTANFKVEQYASVVLKEDKRVKVQAGGLVGGLFLGILLALLVDKFDKRLRDPRDIEPLFGATLLGTIPRIQELKRVKGEQARNLIAEEFRIIRTQVLFGNPSLTQKLIAVTSPNPGDGKTSLAVNLAISIAKAGRRVLLIDGDLRKPDVHRVFNVPDSPGFAELIQGSHEPGAVIKKSEVDGLEVLPAGTPITRPSELLSRPEMARLLHALGELYDHIVLDTAPLLPVSDTHVLAGMMDGVIVSFNAEVDRDTIALTQEILQRSRANIIGTVMNQVKYRQSGSFHRGKTAYDSYYNSPRGAPKSDKLATVGKQ